MADYVAASDIARRLGVSRAAVSNWKSRKDFPTPAIVTGGSDIWEWETIEQWCQENQLPKSISYAPTERAVIGDRLALYRVTRGGAR